MTHPDITIRAATVDDLPTVLALIHEKAQFDGCPEAVTATPEKLQRDLFGPTPLASVLLVEVGGAIAGFATYHAIYSSFLAKPGLWMDDLYLRPPFRRQGIGRSLIQTLSQIAQARGCGRIDWTVATDNASGIQFYRTMQAEVVETVRLCRLTEAAIAHHAALSNHQHNRFQIPSESR